MKLSAKKNDAQLAGKDAGSVGCAFLSSSTPRRCDNQTRCVVWAARREWVQTADLISSSLHQYVEKDLQQQRHDHHHHEINVRSF